MKESHGFTKENTLEAKGVAIMLMVMHHLFAYPNRVTSGAYQSILHIGNFRMDMFLAGFGNICIGMYLFLSGIGAFHKYKNKNKYDFSDSFRVIRVFFVRYWLIFLIFVPIGFHFFQVKFHWSEFLLNFFCLRSTYNREWWFVSLYLELMLIFPLYRKVVDRYPRLSFLGSGVVAILGFLMQRIAVCDYMKQQVLTTVFVSELYNEVEGFLMWQFMFTIGYLCAKNRWYHDATKRLQRLSMDKWYVYLFMVVSVMVFRSKLPKEKLFDVILVPIFILAAVRLIEGTKFEFIFRFLGKHSINIWLVHTFLCYRYMQWMVYAPKYSIIIYILLILMSLLCSVAINALLELVKKIYQYVKKLYGRNVQVLK